MNINFLNSVVVSLTNDKAIADVLSQRILDSISSEAGKMEKRKQNDDKWTAISAGKMPKSEPEKQLAERSLTQISKYGTAMSPALRFESISTDLDKMEKKGLIKPGRITVEVLPGDVQSWLKDKLSAILSKTALEEKQAA